MARMLRILGLAALTLGVVADAPGAEPNAPEAPVDASSLYASHGRRGAFFNPWASDDRSLWKLLRWQLLSRNPYDRRRPPQLRVVANDGAYLAGVEHSATVTWVGHATFAIHDRDDVFLTDPHFGPRALLPRRAVPPGIPLASVPPDALAVISHNHYDHLDEGTVAALPDTVRYFVPLGLAEWFRERGRRRVVELDWWQSARQGRWTITCLPSQHWSRRFGQGENETLWCAWLLDSGDHRYYFAGDTGYFHGFREVGSRFGPIDVAMLPIGAYAPRWFMRYAHMDPAEAWRAFQDLRARFMLPMHWGTFDLTDEPLDLPPRVLGQVVEEAGGDPARVRILAVGERWKVPETAARAHEMAAGASR